MGGMPGYDAILQAMGGIMSVNGTDDSGPTRVGLPVVDMVTGINAVVGVLLLQNRQRRVVVILSRQPLMMYLSLLHPHAANYALRASCHSAPATITPISRPIRPMRQEPDRFTSPWAMTASLRLRSDRRAGIAQDDSSPATVAG